MKKRTALDRKSCEDQSIDWGSFNDEEDSMSAGCIDCSDYSEHPTGEHLADLQELDARLRRPQTFEERSSLYHEILERGDSGDGYSLCFGNELQEAEFHCEQLNYEAKTREHLESVLAAVEEGGSIFSRIGDLWVVADGGIRAPLLEDRKGMAYIHALLKHDAQESPAGGLTPRELCGMFNPLPPGEAPAKEPDKDTPTPGTDADGLAIDHHDAQESRGYSQAAEDRGFTPEKIAAAVRELRDQLREANENGDTEKAKTIRKALRELGEGNPKKRRLPPDRNRERMRDSVRRAIGRALAEIGRYHAPAAKYLDKKLTTEDGRWRYTGKPFTT